MKLKSAGTISGKLIQKKVFGDVSNKLNNQINKHENLPSNSQMPLLKMSKTPLRDVGNVQSAAKKRTIIKSESDAHSMKKTSQASAIIAQTDWPEPETMSIEEFEDDYEDIWPNSQRLMAEDVYKLVNFWELCRPPLPDKHTLDLEKLPEPPSTPLSSPFSSAAASPDIPVMPVPTVPYQIWNDDDY
uniref:Uncharacterized protein n=1 Tax=Timema poppense TaxID=170557 RepID=A0A7R9DNZ3_TIMPO|nr:unnamed protein product [Timema poppensis]